MTWRTCAEPGCPVVSTDTYCPAHHNAHRQAADARRPNSTTRGYNHKWARTRGRYLKHHPNCQHPGCTAPATEVHHLDGAGPTGPDGHRWANLQALCKTHHSSTTARQQPGGWHNR